MEKKIIIKTFNKTPKSFFLISLQLKYVTLGLDNPNFLR
jgi:hypothetical protein